LHYPLLAALAAYGVAGTKVLALAPGEALSDEKRLLLCGALADILITNAGFDLAEPEREEDTGCKPQIWMRLAATVILVILALWGGGLGAPLLVTIVALLIIALVAFDLPAATSIVDPAR